MSKGTILGQEITNSENLKFPNNGEGIMLNQLKQIVDFNNNPIKIDSTQIENISEIYIRQGSYGGTGRFGSGNRTRLTLGFYPDAVIVQGSNEEGFFVAIRNSTYIYPCGFGSTSSSEKIRLGFGGDFLEWYNDDSANKQFNGSGRTYYYVAIGHTKF